MTNFEKEACRQLGGHINSLTGECDFSDCERREAICSYGLAVFGVVLLIIRLASIPTYTEMLHASNFIVIMTAIALMFQLRSSLLNGFLLTCMPLLLIFAIYDIITFFSGINPTIWNATYHIPPFVLGLIIFIYRYQMTNVISAIVGYVSLVAWLLFIDPRVEIIPLLLLVHTISTVVFSIDLYRNGMINGILCEPICDCS